ncbi:MAG: hypothetical protein KDD35_01170 [Bdellovibrionales bacterium]|nr:hypothetical protein [Bdellovibrionales bacterium]
MKIARTKPKGKLLKSLMLLVVISGLYFNCNFQPMHNQTTDRNGINSPFGEKDQRQTIVIHPFEPGGDDGNSEVFVQNLIHIFGESTSWRGMDLGFVLVLNPMQEKPESLLQRIGLAFKVAKQYNIRLLVHINHEWLFGFYPPQDSSYGNWMIEQITGVKVAGINNYQRTNNSPEIANRVEWKSWTEPLSQYSLYWGSESIQPPKINYKSDFIRNFLFQRGELIKDSIESSIRQYLAGNEHLFLGVDVGWETSVDDQDENVSLGYRAIMDSGFLKDQLTESEFNNQLGEVAKEFVDFTASLYLSELIPKEKIFSHYLLLDRDQHFPGYRYERWIRNPAHLAKTQNLTPGFSTYCTSNDCHEVFNELQDSAPGRWAITESGPGLLPIMIHGFPHLNVRPPSFMTLYSFGANIRNNDKTIKLIQDLLQSSPPIQNPEPEPTPIPEPNPVPNPMPNPVPNPTPSLPNSTKAIGYIDGSGEGPNGTVGVGGWACIPGLGQSIKVQIYVKSNDQDSGILVGEALANLDRDPGVASFCQSPSIKHGFAYLISAQDRLKYAQQKIYVYGFSKPFGGQNEPLNNSGQFLVVGQGSGSQPSYPSGAALGHLDGLGEGENGNLVLGGWTCVPGFSQSIRIGVYVGGEMNRGGVLIGEMLADREREVAVSATCQTNFKRYGFAFIISPKDRNLYAGKPVYVHALTSGAGATNESLKNSGNFIVTK